MTRRRQLCAAASRATFFTIQDRAGTTCNTAAPAQSTDPRATRSRVPQRRPVARHLELVARCPNPSGFFRSEGPACSPETAAHGTEGGGGGANAQPCAATDSRRFNDHHDFARAATTTPTPPARRRRHGSADPTRPAARRRPQHAPAWTELSNSTSRSARPTLHGNSRFNTYESRRRRSRGSARSSARSAWDMSVPANCVLSVEQRAAASTAARRVHRDGERGAFRGSDVHILTSRSRAIAAIQASRVPTTPGRRSRLQANL